MFPSKCARSTSQRATEPSISAVWWMYGTNAHGNAFTRGVALYRFIRANLLQRDERAQNLSFLWSCEHRLVYAHLSRASLTSSLALDCVVASTLL